MTEPYDILIRNTEIIDGTGKAAFKGNVAILGDRIVDLGSVSGGSLHEIDGSKKVTCPGFIDPHSHADVTFLKYPLAENLIMQGITTVIAGNCGMSLAPFKEESSSDILIALQQALGGELSIPWRTFDEWLGVVEQHGIAVNYAPLVGHSMLRTSVMGMNTYQHGSEQQIKDMTSLLRESLQSGAFGLSIGLDGAWPGAYAQRDEFVHLAKVAHEMGGFLAPHTRFHQNQWPASRPDEHGYGIYHGPKGEIFAGRYHGLLEAVEISRQANRIPLNIAHFTPAYSIPIPHPDYVAEAIAKATLEQVIDRAWDDGIKAMFNVVAWEHHIAGLAPIIDSFYSMHLSLPGWLRNLPREDFIHGIKKNDFRQKIKELIYSGTFKFQMVNPVTEPYWMDHCRVLVCRETEFIGKTIGELARNRNPHSIVDAVYDQSLEVLFDLLSVDPETKWVFFRDSRHDRVLSTFLKHPAASPCTDGYALSLENKEGNGLMQYGVCPNYYSMFPHYIQEFVKENQVLSLEEAIMKATSIPAREVLGLHDRGVLKKGAYADLVIFDYHQLHGSDDYLHAAQPPGGIAQVIVNGKIVFDQQSHTGLKPGKVLRKA